MGCVLSGDGKGFWDEVSLNRRRDNRNILLELNYQFISEDMAMPIYNKLVRDRIPEIIEASGKAYTTRILSEEEYIVALQNKCLEEFEEYRKAESSQEALEELADLLEVMNALCKVHGASLGEVDEMRKEKAAMRGGFEEKVFLMEVEDDES